MNIEQLYNILHTDGITGLYPFGYHNPPSFYHTQDLNISFSKINNEYDDIRYTNYFNDDTEYDEYDTLIQSIINSSPTPYIIKAEEWLLKYNNTNIQVINVFAIYDNNQLIKVLLLKTNVSRIEYNFIKAYNTLCDHKLDNALEEDIENLFIIQ